jgi:carboxymethylenebutenolidase
MLAARVPDLAAGVPFYGRATAADGSATKAPMQIHYAGADTGVNNTWPAYEAALKAAGVSYEMHMYEGAQHGFNNDTTPRYDEKSAKLAWTRTIDFFNKHVRR